MNVVIWGAIYVVLSVMLGLFLFKEKQIIEFFKEKEKIMAEKIENVTTEKKSKDKTLGDILTFIGIIILFVFFLLVDKTPDSTMPIKNMVIYIVFGAILINLIIRKSHELMILISAVMLILSKAMFNIQDVKFYIMLIIMLIIGCLLMLLYKEELAKSFHAIETTITAVVIVLIIQTFFLGNYVVPTASMSPTIEPKDRFFANMILYKFTDPKKGDIIAFKEPKDNKVMYTKRLIGEPGQTLQIAEDGKLMIDGSYSGLPVAYEKDGILGGDKIYIPKKGDKVKLDKIIMIGKGVGKDDNGNDAIGTDWSGLQIADRHKEITAEEFLNIVGTKKNLQQYIANDSSFNKDDINDMKNNTYFLYTLKVEGRDEKILPILDFKYDSAKLEKLLSGETLTLDHDYYIAMGDNTKNSLDSRYWGYVQDNRIKGKILVRFWPLNKFGLIK